MYSRETHSIIMEVSTKYLLISQRMSDWHKWEKMTNEVSVGSRKSSTLLIIISNNLELKQPSLVCNGLQHKFFGEGFFDCLKESWKGNIIIVQFIS